MKKLITILSLFLCFSLFGQNFNDCLNTDTVKTKFGYNSVYSINDNVYNNDKYLNLLAEELLKENPNNKVLRYESGEGLLEENFNDERTLKFIMLCKLAGVSDAVLRAKIADIKGSVATLNLLETYTINVDFIEIDNEPYLEAKDQGNFWEWLFRGVSPKHYNRQANRYARKGQNLVDAFTDEYGEGIKQRMAYSTPIPYNYLGEVWYNALLKKFEDIPTVIIHVYIPEHMIGQEELYKAKLVAALEQIKSDGKRIIATEVNTYNYENLSDSQAKELFNKPETSELYCWIMNILVEYGVELINHQYLVSFHDTPFSKWQIKGNQIIDNYKN